MRRTKRDKADEELRAAKRAYTAARADVDRLQERLNHAREQVAFTEADLLAAQRATDGRVVQVLFKPRTRYGYSDYATRYSYRVPDDFPDLEVGDLVITPPTSVSDHEQVVVIASIGRGDYLGPLDELAGYVTLREGYRP